MYNYRTMALQLRKRQKSYISRTSGGILSNNMFNVSNNETVNSISNEALIIIALIVIKFCVTSY